MRAEIGVENLMWGSDYPHTESTFPRSQSIVDTLFVGVPDDDRRAMTAANAASLYGFDAPPDARVR
jgi:predicted TIM-barrel fold metal-dependent hydrolase